MSELDTSRAVRDDYPQESRRVTVRDLLQSGDLQPGTRLTFTRPRVGVVHHATVTQDGCLRLEDGREFTSPSRAAADAAQVAAIDGWHAWVVDGTGQTLDAFRQRFLDRATPDGDSRWQGSAARGAFTRHEYFKRARESADVGAPLVTTGRDLLAQWGVRRRGPRVNEQIEAELANHGLTTSPAFRKVGLDTLLALVRVPEEIDEQGAEAEAILEDAAELDVSLTVGTLPSALSGVESIAPDASFDEAITRMRLNDYSQLAVLSGERTLRGAVTWSSIAKARHANPDAILKDAVEPAHEVRYDRELIDVLPTLYESGFVFVRNDKNEVAGIVTTSDVVVAYGELATPFVLIGEVDQTLRWIISRTFALENVVSLCGSKGADEIRSFDDLSFGDYVRVLENREMWAQLGWRVDRAAFVKRLDEIRLIRNDLAHFNPDPLPSDAIAKIRHFLALLRDHSR